MKDQREKLIFEYSLDILKPDCMPDAQWWSATITFDGDISEVLPYLNAELSKCDYHHVGHVLIWDRGGKRVAFRSNKIEIAPVESRAEADQVCRDTLTLLEEIWRRRDEITPSLKGKTPPPSLLSVLKLLPGDNCTECGCLTCMAYAAALIQGQAKLSGCVLLSEDSLVKLTRMFAEDIE